MKIEKREFEKGKVRILLFVCENEADSKLFDWLVGDKVGEDGLIGTIVGQVKLSDGYGEEYLSIQKANQNNNPIRECKYPDCSYYSKTAKNYCCDACYSDHKDSLIKSIHKKFRTANENKKVNRTSPKRRSNG